MSPESSPNFITPPPIPEVPEISEVDIDTQPYDVIGEVPLTPEQAVSEVPEAPALIEVPADIVALQPAADQADVDRSIAEAAERIVSMPEGQTSKYPAGAVEVPTPPAPNHKLGWDGDTKR